MSEVIRNLFPYVLWYADAQKCIIKNITIIYRSSLAEVFFKKNVLKNLSIFTEKHLCRSLFLNTVVGLGSLTLWKMRLRYSCFPVNSAKFLRASIFIKQLPGLLLYLLGLYSSNTEKDLNTYFLVSVSKLTNNWQIMTKKKVFFTCSKEIFKEKPPFCTLRYLGVA